MAAVARDISRITRDSGRARRGPDVTDPEAVPYGEIAGLPRLAPHDGPAFEGVVAHPHVIYRTPGPVAIVLSSTLTALLVVAGLVGLERYARTHSPDGGLGRWVETVGPAMAGPMIEQVVGQVKELVPSAPAVPAELQQLVPAALLPETRYLVQPGDTLGGLAKRQWGDAGQWSRIYEANRNVLRSPSDLTVGAVIVLPR